VVPGAEFVRFNDVADSNRSLTAHLCILLETIQGEGVSILSAKFSGIALARSPRSTRSLDRR